MPHREKIHKGFFAVHEAKRELLTSLIKVISQFKIEGNDEKGRVVYEVRKPDDNSGE